MENIKNNVFSNWSGSVQFTPKEVKTPASIEELQAIVRECTKNRSTIRVVGSGHSFTDVVKTTGTLISLDNLQGVENIDKEKCQATALAGSKLKWLGAKLFENGMAQINLGDIDVQSIAGALSTGTHGTGVAFGTLSTQMIEITLVTANGDLLVCSENENKEIFKAAQVSLGTLGIIVKIRLQLVPIYKLKIVKAKNTLDNVMKNIDKFKNGSRNFEFYWFPHTNIIQTKDSDITDEAPIKTSFLKYFNDIILENGVFKVLSELSRMFPSTSKYVAKISAAGVSTGMDINYSANIFATPRLVKFQEMEYNVPVENAVAVLTEMRETASHFKVHFPVEVRFVKGDDIYISPAYQRDAIYFAVHMYKGMEYKEYFAAMENIFKKYQGRPHWGKLHTRTAKEFAQLYPMWNKFQEIRNKLDPNGLFMNEHTKKIMVE